MYLVGLHVYYMMIHGPYNIGLILTVRRSSVFEGNIVLNCVLKVAENAGIYSKY